MVDGEGVGAACDADQSGGVGGRGGGELLHGRGVHPVGDDQDIAIDSFALSRIQTHPVSCLLVAPAGEAGPQHRLQPGCQEQPKGDPVDVQRLARFVFAAA